MSTAPGQVELSGQALRLVEHDDPGHPVVALATPRIEELSARRGAVDERVAAFDVSATYDKEHRALRLAATLSPQPRPALRKTPTA